MADPDAAADALIDAVPEVDADLVRASAEYLVDPLRGRPGRLGPPGRAGVDAVRRLRGGRRAWSTRRWTCRRRTRTTCCDRRAHRPRRLGHSFGPGGGGREALRAVDLTVAPGEFVSDRRPERVREEHAAAGAGRRAAAHRGARRRSTTSTCGAGPGVPPTWPRRTCCCRGGGRSTTRSSAASSTACRPGRGPGAGARLVRPLRARRLRAGVAARAERRDAPAARPAAHLPVPARRAAARRAVRRAGRDHPAGHGDVARRGVGGRPADRRARHPRRRGGAAAVGPGRGDVGPARHDRRVDPGRPGPAPTGGAGDRPGLRRAAGARSCTPCGTGIRRSRTAARWHTEPPWTSPRSSTPTARPRCSSSGSSDLGRYPSWLDIVPRAEPVAASGAEPAWLGRPAGPVRAAGPLEAPPHGPHGARGRRRPRCSSGRSSTAGRTRPGCCGPRIAADSARPAAG